MKSKKLLTLKNYVLLSNAQRLLVLYNDYPSLSIKAFIEDYNREYKKSHKK